MLFWSSFLKLDSKRIQRLLTKRKGFSLHHIQSNGIVVDLVFTGSSTSSETIPRTASETMPRSSVRSTISKPIDLLDKVKSKMNFISVDPGGSSLMTVTSDTTYMPR